MQEASSVSVRGSSVSDRTKKVLRLLALAALIGSLFYIGTRPGIRGYFEIEYLRSVTAEAGWVGIATFLVLWVAAYLMQIPGVVFAIAAILGWGSLVGAIIGYVGLTASTAAAFWMIRLVGGSPVADLENEWARKILSQLEDHPIRTVALLRTVFVVNPVVNVSLVLTDISFRDYLLGSLIGFVPPLFLLALGTETAMYYLVG